MQLRADALKALAAAHELKKEAASLSGLGQEMDATAAADVAAAKHAVQAGRYTCMYIYICACMCLCLCVLTHIFVQYDCVYTCCILHVYMCKCVYMLIPLLPLMSLPPNMKFRLAGMHVCVYIYICLCICVCVCVDTHSCVV